MSGLADLPPWATTGIGSLPHKSVKAAVAHSIAAYDVPFCPQLPRLEGDMIAQWLGTDPPAPHRDHAAADGARRLRPVLDALARKLDRRQIAAYSLLTRSCRGVGSALPGRHCVRRGQVLCRSAAGGDGAL
jgi:hypothetical protein